MSILQTIITIIIFSFMSFVLLDRSYRSKIDELEIKNRKLERMLYLRIATEEDIEYGAI